MGTTENKNLLLMKKFILLMALSAVSVTGFGQSANRKLVDNYYRAYEVKDWHLLKSILSPAFRFTSPNDKPLDLEAYHQRCWPNSANTKKFNLEKVMMGKDDAFVTYNGYTNDGRIFRNTEYFKFKDGRITENNCYFGPGVSFPNSGKK